MFDVLENQKAFNYYERLRRRGLSHLLALLCLRRWLDLQPRSAIAQVQIKKDNSVANTSSATFDVSTTAGNLLIAIFAGTQAGAITPHAGFVSAVSKDSAAAGTFARIAIYYYENAPAISGAISFTMTGASVTALLLAEYSGCATSSVLDKTASASGSASTSPVTGTTATTAQDDELLIGGLANPGGATFATPTNSFSLIQQDRALSKSFNVSAVHLERIVAATGTYSSGATQSSADYAGVIATFKGSAAAAGFPRSQAVIIC